MGKRLKKYATFLPIPNFIDRPLSLCGAHSRCEHTVYSTFRVATVIQDLETVLEGTVYVRRQIDRWILGSVLASRVSNIEETYT